MCGFHNIWKSREPNLEGNNEEVGIEINEEKKKRRERERMVLRWAKIVLWN